MKAEVDVITSEDLPRLRAEMIAYAEDGTFSDEFRDACRTVVAAIDQARDEDKATHAALEASLNGFVVAGQAEVERGQKVADLCNRIADADDTAIISAAIIDLVPILSRRNVLLVAEVITSAMSIDQAPAIDFDLAAMPAASAHLH
jgi:hypothetical protein